MRVHSIRFIGAKGAIVIDVVNLNKSFKRRHKPGSSGKPGGSLFSRLMPSLTRRTSRTTEDGTDRVHILKDVSFTARSGEIYGLLGPNGAGKTTTLRCMATLLKGDRGDILVNGLDVLHDARAVRAQIGFLTSDMKMAGNLTPRELLEFFGRLNHLDKGTIARRTGELATYLDMRGCLDTKVEKCSTGEKQKTAIAVSLIHDPDVILFDEPTNGLDILAVKTVVDFLRDYKARGKTVVLSTHVMSEAESLCDRIGIMLEGRIVAEGSLDELKRRWHQPDLSGVFFTIARERGLLPGVGGSNAFVGGPTVGGEHV
jgi:sodium transport system ATP-binding protein